MVCVAIMSDIPGSQSSGDNLKWTSARLGQSALILELVAVIQQARRVKEESSTSTGPAAGLFGSKEVGENMDLGSMTKFAVELESRLAILIEAKVCSVCEIPIFMNLTTSSQGKDTLDLSNSKASILDSF